MGLKQYLPILEWLPKYTTTQLKGDVAAGLTVGVLLIPQGMAYAMLAGMPPIYGLYASIVPLILYAIFGTSGQLAVGPVAMISILIAAGVGTLVETGSVEFIDLVIILALMIGMIQVLLGIFRLGFLVNFLSQPVIAGFTSAAAFIIGFSQLKHLLGISIPRSNYIHEIVSNTIAKADTINFPTLIIGLLAIAVMLFIKKMKWPIPGSLLVVFLGILGVWASGWHDQGVQIVKTIPAGLPTFGIPEINITQLKKLAPIALTIAFISFIQSIAIVKAVAAKEKGQKIVPNQEFIALGMANIGGAFFQSFPVTGGFSRTAVNVQAGAKTGMAAIISAGFIALTLLFFTPLFYYLPKAILAALIMVAVLGLIDFKEAKHLWHTDRGDFWMMAATFFGTLLLGVEEGILIGATLSLALIIFRTTQPHTAALGKIPEKPYYRNIKRFEQLEVRKDILIFRFDARLYFANVNYFNEKIQEEIDRKGEELKLVIIDAEPMNGIDSSGVHALKELAESCTDKKVKIYLAAVKGPIRDILFRAGLVKDLGEESFFFRIQHAVDFYDKKEGNRYSEYALQRNEEG